MGDRGWLISAESTRCSENRKEMPPVPKDKARTRHGRVSKALFLFVGIKPFQIKHDTEIQYTK